MESLRIIAGRARRSLLDVAASRVSWPSRPEQLTFEIAAACVARCIHCPRHDMDRPKRPMDFTLPRLAGYLAYIRTTSHRFRLLLNTNGYDFSDIIDEQAGRFVFPRLAVYVR